MAVITVMMPSERNSMRDADPRGDTDVAIGQAAYQPDEHEIERPGRRNEGAEPEVSKECCRERSSPRTQSPSRQPCRPQSYSSRQSSRRAVQASGRYRRNMSRQEDDAWRACRYAGNKHHADGSNRKASQLPTPAVAAMTATSAPASRSARCSRPIGRSSQESSDYRRATAARRHRWPGWPTQWNQWLRSDVSSWPAQHRKERRASPLLNRSKQLVSMLLVERNIPRIAAFEIGQCIIAVAHGKCAAHQR